MNKLAIGAIVIASAALAGNAMAENAPRGWYGSVRTGVSIMNDPSFTVTVAPDELVTRLKTKNAWAVAAEEGYYWGNVRFGIDVSYQKHDVNGIEFISADGVPITPADVEDIKAALVDAGVLTASQIAGLSTSGTVLHSDNTFAAIRQVGVMANISYDIPTGTPFKPYVTGGVGGVGTHVESFDAKDSVFTFAWQVGAGAAIDVSPKVQLTADYRFREVSAGNFGAGLGANLHLGTTRSHFIGGGARVRF